MEVVICHTYQTKPTKHTHSFSVKLKANSIVTMCSSTPPHRVQLQINILGCRIFNYFNVEMVCNVDLVPSFHHSSCLYFQFGLKLLVFKSTQEDAVFKTIHPFQFKYATASGNKQLKPTKFWEHGNTVLLMFNKNRTGSSINTSQRVLRVYIKRFGNIHTNHDNQHHKHGRYSVRYSYNGQL